MLKMLSHFAVCLRAELQQHSEDKQKQLILGRLVVVLNDAIALDYTSVLTSSADPGKQ